MRQQPDGLERPTTAVLDEIEDVLLGDAAAGAGAVDFCEIHVVLAGEFANERRGADIGFFIGSEAHGAGSWRDGSRCLRLFWLPERCGRLFVGVEAARLRALPGRGERRRRWLRR